MNQLNQVILEGNVCVQPETKTLKSGKHWCTVPIAVNRKYKNMETGEWGKEVSYFEVETYGNFADLCVQLCPKGRGLRVVGRLKQDRWESEGGKSHSRVKIIADHIEFMPIFKKETDGSEKISEARVVDSDKTSDSRKAKLAMLAEAAQAAQNEQESGEEIAF